MKIKYFKAGILVFILAIPAFLFLLAHLTGENHFDLPRLNPVGVRASVDGKQDTLYKALGDFTLMNQEGQLFNSKNLKGKITVASFIFTSCKLECPMITSNMAKVFSVYQGDEEIKLLSLTVDPQTDTPAVLKSYRQMYDIESDQWEFLTSPNKDSLYGIIQTEFLMNAGEQGHGTQKSFIHTDQVVLMDKEGITRGYFDGTDELSINEMIAAIKILQDGYSK